LLAIQPSNVRFVKGDASQVKSKKSISLDNFLETDVRKNWIYNYFVGEKETKDRNIHSALLQNSTMPKALLFTDKPTTTPLYKALSVDFVDRMLFGEVKKSVKEAVESFGISNFPTLVVLTPDSGAVEYSGKLKKNALEEFLNQHALPASEKSKEKNKSKVKKEKSKKREDDTFSESETAACKLLLKFSPILDAVNMQN
jgi:protein disulfide-isomerase A6